MNRLPATNDEAMIVLCGEAWGENELKIGQPFVGAAGIQLLWLLENAGLMELTAYDRSMLKTYYKLGKDPTCIASIWVRHPEFHRTNVFQLHPERNDLVTLCAPRSQAAPGLPALKPGKYLRSEFLPHIERLRSELEKYKPNLVIALGGTATWALLGTTAITKVRGVATYCKMVPTLKCLPTYHPAAILPGRQYELRPTIVRDLEKAKREAAFPEVRRPERIVYIEPTLEDLAWFYESHIRGASRLGVDIETDGDQISCIAFAPSIATALTVPFIDRRNGGNYWPDIHQEMEAWKWIRYICNSETPKVFQNGLFDVHRLWRGYGIRVNNVEDDTMLLSHSLHPEALKGLAYLGSIYTDEASWKLEVRHGKTTKKEN